eukprot:NODE_7_length_67686_cov_1.621421.p50 type:complete len:146 gc:universal NODE_7_length_67686_cov_1.621421:51319-50882(-)
MVSVNDVAADKFINAFAQHLKKQNKLEIPSWVDIVKTSLSKELPPSNPDWYYVRVASIIRQLYVHRRSRTSAGVGRLSDYYGAKFRRGSRPSKHLKASTGIIRKALQGLQKLGYVNITDNGRRITKLGQKEADTIATSLTKVAKQ